MTARDIVLAGFGGQGILLAGRLLAAAAMRAGMNALVHNYYEGFVRGGISECTVVLDEGEIDSPVRTHPGVVAVLDARAARNWTPRVRAGGLLLRNATLMEDASGRDDVTGFDIPATAIAAALGNAMCASMVAVGALAPLTRAFALADCLAALEDVVPAHRQALITLNGQALSSGAAFVAEHAHAAV